MNAPFAANFGPIVSRNAFHKAIAQALSLCVGRGRRYTIRELSEATGVPERQLECAKLDPEGIQAEDWRPLKSEELASLDKFLGVAFANARLGLSGLGAFELMEGEQPPLPKVLTADSPPVPRETPREKVERLQRELFDAIEELTA